MIQIEAESDGKGQKFAFEPFSPDLDSLKEKGYVGFGAIAIIFNEKGEILLVHESTNRVGQNKKDRWGLVMETGKEGETHHITMFAGIASELGYKTLSNIKQIFNMNFGFDLRRTQEDNPSKSLISMFYLQSDMLPKSEDWGFEVQNVRWINIKDLLELQDDVVRHPTKSIIREIEVRQLHLISELEKITPQIPSQVTPEYIDKRENFPDLSWI